MGLYNRILGHPLVYEKIRPLVVGGIDVRFVYESLNVTASDVVFDVGCGMGEALKYLPTFQKFFGVDVDPQATRVAEERAYGRTDIIIKTGYLSAEDVVEHRPTCAVMSGVLHHCDDKTVKEIFGLLRQSSRLTRVVTSDIVYLPGEIINNTLAWLDRGRFCRTPERYQQLAREAGYETATTETINCNPNGNGFAKYFVMVLTPQATHTNANVLM